jgi:hypothetical protein
LDGMQGHVEKIDGKDRWEGKCVRPFRRLRLDEQP